MSKNAHEKRTVRWMIEIYCRGRHGTRGDLCETCRALWDYATLKLEKCPFEKKPKCSDCRVHCYNPGHREAIRRVMRYSGPRMLFRHPIAAIRHQWGI